MRDDLDRDQARPLLAAVDEVAWGDLYHAYGPATDVPPQLAAVIVGDRETRVEAWWNLWGNIHHQGTIYEATVPAVPILLRLAAWRTYPDRGDALLMLRDVGAAEGVDVWRYGDDGELVTLGAEQDRSVPVLRATLDAGADELLARWRDEPEPIRRCLLWLLSVLPEHRTRYGALIDETLPDHLRAAWEFAVAGAPPETWEESDAIVALEDWVHEGLL